MWHVKYWRRCPEWHEQSSPYIVNEKGEKVAEIPCFTYHPGAHDPKSLEIAERIVKAVNMLSRVESLARKLDVEIENEEKTT
jgi:hypothetical protein